MFKLGNESNSTTKARKRWEMLSKAILKNCHKDDAPVITHNMPNRHSVFQLFTFQPLLSSMSLYECNIKIRQEFFSVVIQFPQCEFTLTAIAGFNNTGNVCVWPSEEVMAYYVLNNLSTFHDKYVLELGGGMTCLTGLMLAKYSTAAKILLTDGNTSSIENVRTIIHVNNMDIDLVSCAVLEWGQISQYNVDEKYDFILSADCTFFEEVHNELVQTIWMLLADTGVATIFAPPRGDTFRNFVVVAEERGFRCTIEERYNDEIWRQHRSLKQQPDYDENKLYPVLLLLTKS